MPEHGAWPGDAVVARQRQLAPATQRVAADRGDDESWDAAMASRAAWISAVIPFGVLGSAELGDVGTGGEDLLPPRDHHGTGRVGRQLLGRLVELTDAAPPTAH